MVHGAGALAEIARGRMQSLADGRLVEDFLRLRLQELDLLEDERQLAGGRVTDGRVGVGDLVGHHHDVGGGVLAARQLARRQQATAGRIAIDEVDFGGRKTESSN